MSDSDFQELTNDVRVFPGPRLFLVSGYDADEIESLSGFLEGIGYPGVPVKYCTASGLDSLLETVLSEEALEEPAGKGKLPTVMVFSGMTSADVQTVMGRFKECGLPRPIFATTTPTNLKFTVKTLLQHLLEEQRAAGIR
ncbi:MAG: DUF3783 domain-containing protein [Deltaproteobacteria bacterium]|nr:DUF3783 domain-containing protein [Deltaproteobacteria bacterium]